MASGARPDTGKEERYSVSGQVTLWLENTALSVVAELKDASLSGFCVQHHCVSLQAGSLARISNPNIDKIVRVVWVRHFGDRVESGLLQQETYLRKRAIGGDSSAFTELIAPHLRSLRLAIRSILRNREDTDEALQETLLKVALHLHQVRPGGSLKPWLSRIATHEALKQLRRNRRHSRELLGLDEGEGLEEKPVKHAVDPGDAPIKLLERRERATAISAAMNTLADIYRQIFLLCDVREVPVVEAAGLLGLNIDTANTRLHRARQLMRKQLLQKR